MGARRGSGWWDGSWNPVGGCSPVSEGCRFCCAAKLAGTNQATHRIPLYKDVVRWRYGRAIFNGPRTEEYFPL